ncbi:MAG: glycosyltransferase family 9 protein, partial [Nitrospira sp.]|nr:glycosyltransferase family 9 protein [Nitrospira sp.]
SEMGIKIVILGTDIEKDIALKIKGDNPGVIDLTGKTTFSQLAAILRRCKLLVSNDTGTAHLASAVGTRVIGLYMCHAYPIETGPYGRGHITISPTLDCYPCKWKEECAYNYKCRDYIAPRDVLSVVKWALSPVNSLNSNLGNIQVDISIFDEDGSMSYIPLVKRPLKFDDVLRIIYKNIWNNMLNIDDNLQLPAAYIHWLREAYELENQEVFNKKMEDVLTVVRNMESLADKGINKIEELINRIFSSDKRDLTIIQAGMEELRNIDSLITGIGEESPEASPLSTYFIMQKGNTQGDNPVQMLRDSAEVYNSLKLNLLRFSHLSDGLIKSLFQMSGLVNA